MDEVIASGNIKTTAKDWDVPHSAPRLSQDPEHTIISHNHMANALFQ